MHRAMNSIWKRSGSERPLFSSDEVRNWGDATADSLEQLGLIRETEAARSLVCDACPEPHEEEIIWVPSVSAPSGFQPVMPCPEVIMLPVDPDRLRQWTVDRSRVANTLATLLELSGYVDAVSPDRFWSLGRKRLAGRFRDFHLYFGPARNTGTDFGRWMENARHFPAPVLLVPWAPADSELSRSTGIPVFALPSILSFDGTGLSVDLDYIEDALPHVPQAPRAKPARSAPVPAGALWPDVELILGESQIEIKCKGAHRKLGMDELGFGDSRKLDSSGAESWKTLLLFAHNRGKLRPEQLGPDDETRENRKKQIRNLRKHLQSVFPIDGNPIDSIKGEGSYVCKFRIRLSTDVALPIPHGASWMSVRVEETRRGSIQFTFRIEERFGAWGTQSGERASREPAVRDSAETQEYSLENIGLVDQSGQVTKEGATLQQLLRAGGKLRRAGDDLPTLRLAKILAALIPIEGSPLQFSADSGVWTANFESDSHLR